MRIPLDYYRILGLPIQATAEQLVQAHRDRTLQLPRSGYSSAAIGSRKKLLDEAATVLGDPQSRQTYDTSFLAKTYDTETVLSTELTSAPVAPLSEVDPDPHTPSVEIDDQQFVGALLILQELGEYELVLKLGRSYLNSSMSLKDEQLPNPQIVRADIVLTVALAYLELGREQWQQGQYENAAGSLQAGQALLLREGLFASVRGEMQSDLYKLRPYRILELLAKPEEDPEERRKGLQLLKDMLQERSGIDGNKIDGSGLSTDDFLRFIQQLRSYLTASEQQNLFEIEARRPSAVATYLAVYALLARGFAYGQPELVHRAKLMLMRLGRHQDVHLEVAICALLLGQTEEASQALELSQEYEAIGFIRENSQGSTDLLPGLCLYTERWLQAEVFRYFRDLINKPASLKDYFANQQVQSYLEKLPTEDDSAHEWVPLQKTRSSSPQISLPPAGEKEPSQPKSSWSINQFQTATATLISSLGNSPANNAKMPQAERMAERDRQIGRRESGKIGNNGTRTWSEPESAVSQQPQGLKKPGERKSRGSGLGNNQTVTQPGGKRGVSKSSVPKVTWGKRLTNTIQSVRTKFRTNNLSSNQVIWLAMMVVIGLGLLSFVSINTYAWLVKTIGELSGPKLIAELPGVSINHPPITIPNPNETNTSTGPLTESIAKQTLDNWLSIKAQALGKDHNVKALKDILDNPALAEWQKIAEEAEHTGSYREYEHDLSIDTVTVDEKNLDQATVQAQVNEVTQFYEDGKLSYTQNDQKMLLEYNLGRQDGQWRIKSWQVKK